MDTILYPIMWIIAWIMSGVHSFLTTLGMGKGPGPAWVLAIVGLTIVVRALMIPLFNKQTKSMRAAQELNPEIQRIQKKYKNRKDQVSMQRQQEELQALYREHGTSPFSSCLPMLIQMPIFFALFRLLYAVKPLSEGIYRVKAVGPINEKLAEEISRSTLFGAPLSSSIGTAKNFATSTNILVVAVVLIALMIATLFFTQKQIMTKNMPEKAMDPNNPAYKMQKYMLYGMPMIYIFTGTTFQVGVLIYWLVGNIWNIGQQTWLLNTNPTPGSAAYKKRQAKLRAKRIAKGLPPEEGEVENTGQRPQPLGKERAKKAQLRGKESGGAQAEKGAAAEVDADSVAAEPERGKDGLTDEERARKRYERRLAQRQRSQEKKKARKKRAQKAQKPRNF